MQTGNHTQKYESYLSDYSGYMEIVEQKLKEVSLNKLETAYEKIDHLHCKIQFCKQVEKSGLLNRFGRWGVRVAELVGFGFSCFRAARIIYLVATLVVGFTPVGAVVVPILWFGGGTVAALLVEFGVGKLLDPKKSISQEYNIEENEKEEDEIQLEYELNKIS